MDEEYEPHAKLLLIKICQIVPAIALLERMKIISLADDVRSLLRTGVAVTSVTQCVEELVLNSLDAGATCVAVRIDLKCFRIQVVDNGSGISCDDLEHIGNRFYTSKCHTISDLNNLSHCGYRGEALASIRECCGILEITTRSTQFNKTYCKIAHLGKHKKVAESAIVRPSVGTTVTVHELFKNFPVRQKSINNAIELERIKEMMEGIALIRPGISFTLRNDVTGQVIINTRKAGSSMSIFTQLYGSSKAASLSELTGSFEKFRIYCLLGKEGHTRKNLQFVYINCRLVKKTKIHKLIYKVLMNLPAFKMKSRQLSTPEMTAKSVFSPTKKFAEIYPVYVVQVQCPISEYDITFEPTKTMVEFKNWNKLLCCIEDLVKIFVQKQSLNYPPDKKDDQTTTSASPKLDKQKDQGKTVICIENITDVLFSKTARRITKVATVSEYEDVLKTPENNIGILHDVNQNQHIDTDTSEDSNTITDSLICTGETSAGVKVARNPELLLKNAENHDSRNPELILKNAVNSLNSFAGNDINFSAESIHSDRNLALQELCETNYGSLAKFRQSIGKANNKLLPISVDKRLENLNRILPSKVKPLKNTLLSSLQRFRRNICDSLMDTDGNDLSCSDVNVDQCQPTKGLCDVNLTNAANADTNTLDISDKEYSNKMYRVNNKAGLQVENTRTCVMINNTPVTTTSSENPCFLKENFNQSMTETNDSVKEMDFDAVVYSKQTDKFEMHGKNMQPEKHPFGFMKIQNVKGKESISYDNIALQTPIVSNYGKNDTINAHPFSIYFQHFRYHRKRSSVDGDKDAESKKVPRYSPNYLLSNGSKCGVTSMDCDSRNTRNILYCGTVNGQNAPIDNHENAVHDNTATDCETKYVDVYNCGGDVPFELAYMDYQNCEINTFNKNTKQDSGPENVEENYHDTRKLENEIKDNAVDLVNNHLEIVGHLVSDTANNDLPSQMQFDDSKEIHVQESDLLYDDAEFSNQVSIQNAFKQTCDQHALQLMYAHVSQASLSVTPREPTVAPFEDVVTPYVPCNMDTVPTIDDTPLSKGFSPQIIDSEDEQKIVKIVKSKYYWNEMEDICRNENENNISWVANDFQNESCKEEALNSKGRIAKVVCIDAEDNTACESVTAIPQLVSSSSFNSAIAERDYLKGESSIPKKEFGEISLGETAVRNDSIFSEWFDDTLSEHSCEVLKESDQTIIENEIDSQSCSSEKVLAGDTSFREVLLNDNSDGKVDNLEQVKELGVCQWTDGTWGLMDEQAQKCSNDTAAVTDNDPTNSVQEMVNLAPVDGLNSCSDDSNHIEDNINGFSIPNTVSGPDYWSVPEADYLLSKKLSEALRKVNTCTFTKDSLKNVKVIGQVDRKFIACMIKCDIQDKDDGVDTLALIDQHAAHERIRLEILSEAAYKDCENGSGLSSFTVEPPKSLSFQESEICSILAFTEQYQIIGLGLKKETPNSLLVSSIPACLVDNRDKKQENRIYWNTIQELITEHLEVLLSTIANQVILPQTIHKVLCSLSCHGAIKFGDSLTLEECVALVSDLSRCDLPFQCAHGRPTVMPLHQLETFKQLNAKTSRKPKLWKLTQALERNMSHQATT